MHHDYETIVRQALTEPGKVAEAYFAFHEFSMGNQWLAIMQFGRAEPIHTFPGWKAIDRHVKKGARAIELIMPVFKKAKAEVTSEDEQSTVDFIARRNWFGLSMTEGREYTPDPVPNFDFCRCMEELSIRKEPYQSMSGNSMGYAKTAERIIAVSPLAFDPFKTTAHEIAHVFLHPNIFSDHHGLPRDAKEVEVELTAYLVKTALGRTENLEFSRGYIQGWMDDTTMEKVRLGKDFAAADTILKAGRVAPNPSTSPTLAAPQLVP
jgi:hypothetical protein